MLNKCERKLYDIFTEKEKKKTSHQERVKQNPICISNKSIKN